MCNLNQNKKPILLFSFITVFIAVLLDIKYEGLFYRILPRTIQDYVDRFRSKKSPQ